MSNALDGIRVLDLTRVFAGPWASQMLADFGADVVKIEHPVGGDEVRRMGPMQKDASGKDSGHTSSYIAMNRNKRSVTLDMSLDAGQATLHQLAAKADVLIENFKVGSLAKYGLDYATLSKLNPRLIYCSITGYGQTGPYASQPGYDPVFQAMGGLMSVTGQPDGAPGAGPALVGYSVSDINAGLYATISILTALRARDVVTNRGQHIDIALLDTQIAAHSYLVQNYLASGRTPVRAGAASQMLTPWQVFPTADGQVMIAVGNDRQFADFCRAIDLPELATDVRFARIRDRMPNKAELVPAIEKALALRSTKEWVERLNAVGVACGPLHDIPSMMADPQVVHRGMVTEIEDPYIGRQAFIANPMRLSETPPEYRRPAPRLGEHSVEVLKEWLSLSDADAEMILTNSRPDPAVKK
jgi:crotonobetainyl-CoA:carnitine CoA-transferase CaiB-like acyl-CoA transferase